MVSFDGLEDKMTLVFCKPPKLPVRWPFGPSRAEADWSHLEDTLEHVRRAASSELSAEKKIASLDFAYDQFVTAMDRTICEQTDVPVPERSQRGRPPEIMWVPRPRHHKQQYKGWRSLTQPLYWL